MVYLLLIILQLFVYNLSYLIFSMHIHTLILYVCMCVPLPCHIMPVYTTNMMSLTKYIKPYLKTPLTTDYMWHETGFNPTINNK